MYETERSPEEILERNRLQIEDSQRYYTFACQVLGKETLTPSELFAFYVSMGFAKMFEIEWREGKNPANLWYTGVHVKHPPTLTEGWEHYRQYQLELTRVFAD